MSLDLKKEKGISLDEQKFDWRDVVRVPTAMGESALLEAASVDGEKEEKEQKQEERHRFTPIADPEKTRPYRLWKSN